MEKNSRKIFKKKWIYNYRKKFLLKTRRNRYYSKEKDEEKYVFIEVKTRSNLKFGRPKEAVTINKKKHMYKSTRYYLYKNKNNNQFIRFDVIEIIIKGKKDWLNHIKNIEVVEV